MACVAPAAELPSSLPPGFRFHPTDQELINSYLSRKVLGLHPLLNFIPEVDVYSYEPSELPDKSFLPNKDKDDLGAKVECYLFAPRGRKYPSGSRMQRATLAGFWKSTGKDRPVVHHHVIIGMKKTLVYHLGRAPHGMRTDWIMHEYRLHHDRDIQGTYVLCRLFNRNGMTGGADVDKDGIQPTPGSAHEDKGVMQFSTGGADMNKDAMQPMPGGTDPDKGGMEFVLGDAGAYKEGMQTAHGGCRTNDGMQPMCRDTNTGNSRMQFIYDPTWYASALMEEDNSWMWFSDDAGYRNAE